MHELLLGVLLVLAVAWLVIRLRRDKADMTSKSAARATPRHKPFKAVAVKYSENACDAAKAMTGRRFLSSAAPHLPLPECDFPTCRCQFTLHDDRRSGHDRRSPFAPAGSFTTERRKNIERRKHLG